MKMLQTSYVIRRDHTPVKMIFGSEKKASRFTQRLQSRFPNNLWSVSNRFPLEGTD
ncbi:hypothetical protein [Terasakiella sp. SH-1]|uniref:hypothetical protein n=1 Tax=Terasakiella sp. SH-1 TaxID=2560057 RepID=UPI001430CC8D|nr:hypothetical protein [Terasakiella sp. SH-1]